MFAYQITKYCDQNRYIQKIEKAKIILPMSCMRLLVISPASSLEFRMTRQISAIMVTAHRKPPQLKYAGNMVLTHSGASDMTMSIAISE